MGTGSTNPVIENIFVVGLLIHFTPEILIRHKAAGTGYWQLTSIYCPC
jgi:hypothetical protein